VSRSINTVTFVASATASSSRSDDDAMSVASRRRRDKEIDAVPPPPFGLMGVAGDLGAPACGSLVVADVPASPPPRSLTSPRKPHQQTSSYLWSETLRPSAQTAHYQSPHVTKRYSLGRNTVRKSAIVTDDTWRRLICNGLCFSLQNPEGPIMIRYKHENSRHKGR